MNVFVSSVRITESRGIKNLFSSDKLNKVVDTIKNFFLNKENLKDIEIFITFILGIASKWF